jgi:KGK domain
MDSNYQPLSEDDVLQIPQNASSHREPRLMETVSLFTASLKEALNAWPYVAFVTNPSGYSVSILKASSGGWQKGKLRVRIVVEFEPDSSNAAPVEREDNEAWPPTDPVT